MQAAEKVIYNVENNIITPTFSQSPRVEPNGIGCFLFQALKKYKNKIAQYEVSSGKEDTYTSLLNRSVRTAIQMRKLGVNRGDIISICSYNQLDAIVPFIAAQFLGAKVASLDPIIPIDDTTYLASLVQPKMIFFSENATDLIETVVKKGNLDTKTVIFGESDVHTKFAEFTQIQNFEKEFEPVKVDNQETAVIFFSSGTTGLAKGIEISHHLLIYNARNNELYGIDNSCTFNLASMYWISCVTSLLCVLDAGGARVNCKTCSVYDLWGILSKYKVTYAFFSTAYGLQAAKSGRPKDVDLSNLKVIAIGGSTISQENLQVVKDSFHESHIIQGYGQTELGCISIFRPSDQYDLKFAAERGNSVGRPVVGGSYKIADLETNENLGPNKPGELRVKTKQQMNGYYKQDSSDTYDEEGFLKTGDVIYYDDDFCFYVVDRIKEMLKFQCWHVVPAKLEGILLENPEVSQAIVIGKPHDDDGDHPLAVVVRKHGSDVTEKELVKFVEDRVDDKQRLRGGVKFVDELPYTPTGKVHRHKLKESVLKSM